MAGQRQVVVDFAAKHMRKNPDITMSELQDLGRKEGHNIYPLILGLARKQLGWSSKKKRSTKKKRPGRPRKAKTAATRVTKKKRGRRKAAARVAPTGGDATLAITNIVAHVEELEAQVQELRDALSRIAEIASSV